VTANNGFTAVELCEKSPFNLILLDLMMEGKDGFATLREIKKTALNKDTYTIALTAKAYETDRQEVLQADFDDHFPKPFRTQHLLEKIRSVLGED